MHAKYNHNIYIGNSMSLTKAGQAGTKPVSKKLV